MATPGQAAALRPDARSTCAHAVKAVSPDPIRLFDRRPNFCWNTRAFGKKTNMFDSSWRNRHLRLSRNRVLTSVIIHVRFDLERIDGHWKHTAARTKKAPNPIKTLNRVFKQLPQAGDQKVT